MRMETPARVYFAFTRDIHPPGGESAARIRKL